MKQDIKKMFLLLNQARRTRRDDMQAPASPAGGDNAVIQGSL